MTILQVLGTLILGGALILVAWIGITLGLLYLWEKLLHILGRDDE